MKRTFFAFFLSYLLLTPQGVSATEKIVNFNVDIKINTDATIEVREAITYDFSSAERHGIYRDIPVKYKARGGNFRLRLTEIAVVDENSVPYNFTTSISKGYRHLKIGDEDQTITGMHTYIISYKIGRAINYFDTHDELYWNATGNEWTVGIQNASVNVTLPAVVAANIMQKNCFSGGYGSTATCTKTVVSSSAANTDMVSSVQFAHKNLLPGEGLTIVVGFPAGIVYKPTVLENFWEVVKDNGIILLPLIVLVVMFMHWRKRGRDPEGHSTIIAQYEAPDNLSPAEIGVIMDEKVDNHDLSAEIIYFAVHGFLKITRLQKGKFSKDYQLTKLKNTDSLANEFEQTLFNAFFKHASGSEQTVLLSDLKQKMTADLTLARKQLYASMVARGYFVKNPFNTRAKYIVGGIFFVVVGIFMLTMFGVLMQFSFILSGVIVGAFGWFMPQRTIKGVVAREHILGLKKYLTVAEQARMKFHNAPQKNPQQFEKLLPYAMALKVEKEWAQQFVEIYKEPPLWYSDTAGRGNVFSALILVNALQQFSSSTTRVASTTKTAAGGGSGFGGGGFSGGGFGGGGGGSW